MTPLDDPPTSKNTLPLLDLRDTWHDLSAEERVRAFRRLTVAEAEDFFLSLNAHMQAELVIDLPLSHKRHWLNSLPPDDLADLIQELQVEQRDDVMAALDPTTRKEVAALLAYEEDVAGGLMNPRFARVRPDMRVDEAIGYLRRQAESQLETMRYIYVLDTEQKLLGVTSLRGLFMAKSDQRIREVMRESIVCATDDLDQEALKQLFSRSALMAIPVLDSDGRMKGIVTVDDIVEVVEEEATEDMQKLGGTSALEDPYLRVSLPTLIKKRAGWLVILFVGEMLTASAMRFYEHEIAKAIVLVLFIPLIISSGGNSGSQASTLVVRAIALGEVRLRDWWRVFARELIVGTALGLILGAIGMMRVWFWPMRAADYGPHYALIAATVGSSLLGIVLWGSLSGSMLPFVLKRFNLDPATASAPFVATLVDVSGLVIYFTAASLFLSGTLL